MFNFVRAKHISYLEKYATKTLLRPFVSFPKAKTPSSQPQPRPNKHNQPRWHSYPTISIVIPNYITTVIPDPITIVIPDHDRESRYPVKPSMTPKLVRHRGKTTSPSATFYHISRSSYTLTPVRQHFSVPKHISKITTKLPLQNKAISKAIRN